MTNPVVAAGVPERLEENSAVSFPHRVFFSAILARDEVNIVYHDGMEIMVASHLLE